MPDAFPPPQWAQIQEYEAQIARIFEMRKPQQPGRRWYESSTWVGSVTAVITLVLTAVAGYLSQASIMGREQRLSRSTRHSAAMREAIIGAYTLFGTMLKANEERLLLARGKMDPLPRSERDSISSNTNAIQQRWRAERERSAILLYLSAGPKVEAEWDTLRAQLDDFTTCIENAYHSYARSVAPDTTCGFVRSRTLAAARDFKNVVREHLLAVEGPE